MEAAYKMGIFKRLKQWKARTFHSMSSPIAAPLIKQKRKYYVDPREEASLRYLEFMNWQTPAKQKARAYVRWKELTDYIEGRRKKIKLQRMKI